MQKINRALTIGFTILAVIWIMPIITVVINSFKTSTAIALDPFSLPNAETFMKFGNYIKGMTFGNYPFYRSVFYSLVITVMSVALILLCTSMSAWYVSRVDS